VKTTKRAEKVLRICAGKAVLDIGCVDHYASTENREGWLHKRIKSVAAELVGLDYAESELNKLNAIGYEIEQGDAEDFDLGRKFDVIVCGELIEHLFNPGRFLDCARKHMHEQSVLVLTTPNAFAWRRMASSVLFGPLRENREHVAYYSDTTIRQLLARKGFSNIAVDYVESEDAVPYRLLLERCIGFLLRRNLRMILIVTATL